LYPATITEIFDPKLSNIPWRIEVAQEDMFTNTTGGAMPSTIERVAAYTPLVSSGFDGNLTPEINNLQALAQAVDDLTFSGTVPATTALNDFLVGNGAGAWIKKTLAQIKTILGLGTAAYTAATDYAVTAKGVTNGDSHDHSGGDGAQIAYSGLSGLPTIREMLTAARTYYVRTDGSDSNNGLTNSSGGAFLTIQKAIDIVSTLDSSIYDVTIQIADGTYVSNQIICKRMAGSGKIIINGNSGTNTNVVIDSGFLSNTPGTLYQIQNMRLTKSSSSCTVGLATFNGGYIWFTNIDFYTGYTYQISIADNSSIAAIGNYSISGSASWSHIICSASGIFRCESITITLSGTPSFTVFIHVQDVALATFLTVTFSGSATGIRYYGASNGIIQTYAGGSNYFPGNSAGWVETGAQYL
jgi:hypothetical protein